MNAKLNVQSIFTSIDGEANGFDGAGQLTTFIRLKNCNLQCQWCDTKYAQESKPENWMTVDAVVQQMYSKCEKATITGGEPLLQKEALGLLLDNLLNLRYEVTVETNGSVLIDFWKHECHINWVWSSKRVRYVVDFKLPSSGMTKHMKSEVFNSLRTIDVIKFVIANKEDYEYAKILIQEHPNWVAKKVFSPMIKISQGFQQSEFTENGFRCKTFPQSIQFVNPEWPCRLVTMMIKDRTPAQFSLQIHKVLWPGAKEER